MEDGFGRGERGEKRVGVGGRSEADVNASNFLHRPADVELVHEARGEEALNGCGRSEADVKPSNFLHGAAVDIGAESAGDELGAEADAEERLAGGEIGRASCRE